MCYTLFLTMLLCNTLTFEVNVQNTNLLTMLQIYCAVNLALKLTVAIFSCWLENTNSPNIHV